MIQYDTFTLKNGLQVIVHRDETTEIAAFNILYSVGARNENPERTGFAHLFEHLMFGGSVNIPSFDSPLQEVGGENNAFTNNDITNYYITLPVYNLETAFWLESDRMLSLAFTPKSLEVQRQVVMEEFRQRYLNQPYGDAMLYLRPMAYKKHPYQWATIGKELSHIAEASLQEVKDFFFSHYGPDNAILVVAGNVQTSEVKKLAEKWFGPIPSRKVKHKPLPKEPEQKKVRRKTITRDVPAHALYMAFHMGDRTSKDYYLADILSDVLGNGKASRLFQSLVMKKEIFSDLDCYILGSRDPGLLIIEGQLANGYKPADGEKAVFQVLQKLQKNGITSKELEKIKNKSETSYVFSMINPLNRAMNLAFFAWLGDPALINSEVSRYLAVTKSELQEHAKEILRPENCSILHYMAKNS